MSHQSKSLLQPGSTLPTTGQREQVVILDYDPLRPLPMAATCFYMLKLPRYPDSFTLKKNLLIAIRHGASGFEFC